MNTWIVLLRHKSSVIAGIIKLITLLIDAAMRIYTVNLVQVYNLMCGPVEIIKFECLWCFFLRRLALSVVPHRSLAWQVLASQQSTARD